MNYFLDTNICIYFMKGMSENLRRTLLSKHPDEIKIPSIVKAELLYGAEKSNKRDSTMKKVIEFLYPFEIISFDDRSGSVYGKIRAELEQKGEIIGPNDLVIGSTVFAHNGILVTRNEKEFSRIPNLQIENWF